MAERDYLTTRDFLSARDFFEAVRDAVLEGERAHRQISSMKAGEGIRSASLFGGHGAARDVTGMARNDARKQGAKLAALREGMAACAEDGVDATVANVVERMPEVDGRAPTEGQIRNWVKADKNDWCPIVSEGGRGKPGILRDPEMEAAMTGW